METVAVSENSANLFTERRLGKFYVSFAVLERNPERVTGMLSGMLIVEAKANYYNKRIEYVAYSERFDATEDGCEPELYIATGSKNELGELSFHWKRSA